MYFSQRDITVSSVVGMAAAGDTVVETDTVLASNDGDRLYIMIAWLLTILIKTMRVYTEGSKDVWGDNSGKPFVRN